jgi:hypothetical protein
MRWPLRSLPYWVLVTIELSLIVPILLAVPAAFFGPGHSAFEATAGLGGFIGAAIGQRIRQRDFWGLARPLRRRVASAVSAGSTTGDPDLDRIAVSLLEERVRSQPADRWVLPPLAVVCVAVPSSPPTARCGRGSSPSSRCSRLRGSVSRVWSGRTPEYA